MNEQEDFIITLGKSLDEPDIITSYSSFEETELASARKNYDPTNSQYSTYLKDSSSFSETITPDLIESLSENPQSDIRKILQINSIARKLINKNDIVGKTLESIETNVNTEYKISYPHVLSDEKNKKKFEEVKDFIENFNTQIGLRNLIRNVVPTTYSEGNYILYLRESDDGEYIVDYYPLGVAFISDYNIGGTPAVLFDIAELRNRLSKIYTKSKKNKSLFFNQMNDEVEANYPKEVYEAFINKEKYAVLNVKYTGVIRIGNLNRKYGLTPIFRALSPIMMLDTFEITDRINSKAKAKKIIFQKLRKETMGQSLDKKGFDEMAYAHDNFMQAWKQPTVVVTAPPQVENIQYVESKTEMTDVNTVNNYRSKVLNTLGIGFLMDSSSQSVSTASISVSQLLRTINKISEQLEDILQRWYKQILLDNGFSLNYCPTIKIIDSEQLENKIKVEMAQFMYNSLNTSLDTVYRTIGLDVNDEAAKRKLEKEKGYDELFAPRATSYNSKGGETLNDNKDSGRPKNEEVNNKTEYDQEYNKNK